MQAGFKFQEGNLQAPLKREKTEIKTLVMKDI